MGVTGEGAQAYARYHEKSLPSLAQWEVASAVPPGDEAVSSFEIPFPFPVIVFPPNGFGLRGLNTPVMGEWVVAPSGAIRRVSGRFPGGGKPPRWRVGFRCTLSTGE